MPEVGSIGPTRILEAKATRPGYVRVPGVSDFKIKGVPGSDELELVLGDAVLLELMTHQGREQVVRIYLADGSGADERAKPAKINTRV